MKTEIFTFNPFQENTYLLHDETGECVIIDAGCYTRSEEEEIYNFIKDNNLKPVRLLHTHCHVDHMLGNDFFHKKFDLLPECHKKEMPVLTSTPQYGGLFDINVIPSPEPENFLDETDEISFGNQNLKIRFVPGHSPGHIVFIHESLKQIYAGDVIFLGSIGRTDLPYGDHDTLISSIKNELMVLDEDYKVFPGHGPATSIGFEKKNNPFLQSS